MSNPAVRLPRWHIAVVALATAALLYPACQLMFSRFMYYDDEGYVLLSLRNYAQHGRLYHGVYSQYGPFPFVVYLALQKLGITLTHFAGRICTLAFWALAAVLGASLVRQATRRLLPALAVLTAVFMFLWQMTSEPTHPGGLIVALTAIAATFGYRSLALERTRAWAALAGITAALLFLTKVNIGVFASLSAVAWMLLHARNATIRRSAPALLMAGAVLLPLGLMRPLLHEGWVRIYAGVFATSAIAVIATARVSVSPRCGRREIATALAGGSLAAVIVLGIAVYRGTTIGDLYDGIIRWPLKHPTAFHTDFDWTWLEWPYMLGSLALCLLALRWRAAGNPWADRMVVALRLLVAGAFTGVLLLFPGTVPQWPVFAGAAPAVWLFVWPLRSDDQPSQGANIWVALLFLGQFLHAFPVLGSQMAWGTFLIIPLVGVGAWEAVAWIGSRLAPGPALRFAPVALPLATAVLLVDLGWRFGILSKELRGFDSDLGLPGLETVRLSSHDAAIFRVVSLNAVAYAHMLFSEPGMFSFNLWTGLPTPTLANATHWFSLLSEQEQRAIIRALDNASDPCVIRQRSHIEWLEARGFTPRGPLHDYIETHYEPAFTVDGFEFCVRRGRPIVPLMVGDFFKPKDSSAGTSTTLAIRAVLPRDATVGRIEIESRQPGRPLVLDRHDSQVVGRAITVHGAPLDLARPLAWPLHITQATELAITFDQQDRIAPAPRAVIRFLSPDGTELALGCVRQ